MPRWLLLVTVAGIALGASGCGWRGDPTSEVVATYTGGEITRPEISDFVHERLPRCLEHAICPEHGWNHEECSPEDPCEGYCQFHEAMDSPKLYKLIIQELVADEMAKRTAAVRKVDKREDIKDALNHIDEAITIEDLGTRVAERAQVSESEIARYYQDNKQEFSGRSLSEVKDEIRQRLASGAEQRYLDQYIAELKRNANPTINYELLRNPQGGGKNTTLFTVHGERYTLGDFLREFAELPQSEQDKYNTYEKRRELLGKMVERLLVIEGARDEARNPKSEERYERARTLLLAQVLHEEEVDDELKVTDEEVKQFYEENKLHYVTPAEVKLGYIRIQGEMATEEETRAARRAEEACKKLKPGLFGKPADFAEVAREYSADAELLKDGYLIDEWIPLEGGLFSALSPQVVLAIENLRVGDITEPMPFYSDYLILKIVDKKPSQIQSFEDVQEHVRADVETMKHEQMTAELEKKLMEQAKLKINMAALNDMLRQETQQRKRTTAAAGSQSAVQWPAPGGEE